MIEFKGSAAKKVTIEVEEVLSDPSIPKFYANGFTGTIGANDAVLILQQGSNPLASLTMSHDTLFTFYELIGKLFEITKEVKGEHFIDPNLTGSKLTSLKLDKFNKK